LFSVIIIVVVAVVDADDVISEDDDDDERQDDMKVARYGHASGPRVVFFVFFTLSTFVVNKPL